MFQHYFKAIRNPKSPQHSTLLLGIGAARIFPLHIDRWRPSTQPTGTSGTKQINIFQIPAQHLPWPVCSRLAPHS